MRIQDILSNFGIYLNHSISRKYCVKTKRILDILTNLELDLITLFQLIVKWLRNVKSSIEDQCVTEKVRVLLVVGQ